VSDRWAVAVAVAAGLGAWWSFGGPLWPGVLLVAAALALRAPAVLVVAVLLLGGALGARAWPAPAEPREVVAAVRLVDDPVRRASAVRTVVELEGDRYEVWARGSPARRLAMRQAGEQVVVEGRIVPHRGRRDAARHLRGRLEVARVTGFHEGAPVARAANRLRTLVATGGRSLPPVERALYTGMVIGDDRALPADAVDAMRAAGLSHLTAVSGSNVAFLMAVAGPALTRLRPWPRWLATLALLGWFVLVTRAEPSVLRAAAMAVLAATAFVLGRPASTVRLLSLAVAGLVLVDPLLVHAVGFWLSVGATAGIAVLSVPLADRLPGPRPVAAALAVTAAAQVGVAPVTLAVFGSLPLASVPANVAVAPAVAPVTVWGFPAGLVAAVVPDPFAALLQLPTLVCVRWVLVVARAAGAVALPELTAWPAAALAVAGAVVAWRRAGHRQEVDR